MEQSAKRDQRAAAGAPPSWSATCATAGPVAGARRDRAATQTGTSTSWSTTPGSRYPARDRSTATPDAVARDARDQRPRPAGGLPGRRRGHARSATEGHIVNISSIAALRRDSGVYGATKHAVNCITTTLRGELDRRHDPRGQRSCPAPSPPTSPQLRSRVPGRHRRESGSHVEVKPGEHLPDEVLEAAQAGLAEA